MTGELILHQLLLVGAVAGLGGAGLRLASTLAPGGLERILAGLTLGAAGAAVEALGLGLAGFGGDSWALTGAALATYGLARVLVPRPALPPGAELTGWLRTAGIPGVAGAGAGAGIVGAWATWQVRHPLIGPDALTYHLPIATAWVQNGRPGSLVRVLDGFPFGSYPLTNELLVSWALSISRSWVVVSIWSPVLFVGVALGGWVALRELGVGRVERVLAVVAVCVPPLMVGQLGAPYTDIAALAWLSVAAGLGLAARREPGLVYPGVVAAALCVGTKTTPAVLVLAVGVVAWGPLRAARPARLAAALGVGVAVGGIWSVRDLIDHGSPVWPLAAAPWGDPVPAAFRALQARFLDHPRHLLGAYWRDYLAVLGGGAVLLGSGIALPLVRRSRVALAAAGAAGLALVAWGVAPYTGLDAYGAAGAIANTRYLLPAMAACAVAAAVSAMGAGPGLRWTVRGVLLVSIGYSVVKTAAFGPLRPSLATLAVAAVAGAVAAVGFRRLGRADRGAGAPAGSGRLGRVGTGAGAAARVARLRAPAGSGRLGRVGTGAGATARVGRLGSPASGRRLIGGLVGLVGALGLAVGAHGYVGRYLAADNPPDRALYAVPAIRRGAAVIASFPGVFVLLRGDRLEHPLALIGPGEACRAVRARLGRGPVVLARLTGGASRRRLAGCLRGVTVVGISGLEDVFR